MSTLIEFADKLRNQIDIVSVVQAYVQLRHGGQNLKGNCPFHREKTPSFTVSPSKQIFHCFGCGEGGDVIKFVQKAEHLEWVEAVRFLSERFHIPMPELRRDGARAGEQDARQRLVEINKFANTFYAEFLAKALKSADNEITGYLQRRKMEPKVVVNFGLGLAPAAWTDLLDASRKPGFDRNSMVGAGLVIHNQQSDRHYDRFRNRLIFPIHDAQGRPIAFGGRVYASNASPEEPKYVNSPETALYKKGEHLYALHLAKDTIVKEQRVLLMEGYMDVIRAHQFGFTNAVASCGTALTEEQARTLKKYCHEVVFVYDGDDAGQNAMLRGCSVLLEHDFKIRVVVLPGDHDPDSFLLAEGADGFRSALDKATDFFRFFCDAAASRFDRNSTDGKVQIVEFLLPIMKRVRNMIARHELAHRTAEFLDLDDSLVLRQVSDTNERNLERLRKEVEASAATDSKVEQLLLKVAIEHESARRMIFDRLQPEWVRNANVRKWFVYCQGLDPAEPLTWDMLLSRCEEEQDAVFLRALALDDTEPMDDHEAAIKHSLDRMHFHHKRRVTTVLAQQINEFYRDDPEAELGSLTSRLHDSSPGHDLGNSFFKALTPPRQ